MVLQAGDRDTAGLGHVAVAGRPVAAEDHHFGRGIQDLAPVVARRTAPSRNGRRGRHLPEYRRAPPYPADAAADPPACRPQANPQAAWSAPETTRPVGPQG